ncbi:hypothetical protein [Peribacillus saganii]|uniref:hypothetical protein n=1 Tax=Peribacillus saganii TaxID=2303992 RepID=UPI00115D0027|nr:hypothetical protein [Peribacillus saganii]
MFTRNNTKKMETVNTASQVVPVLECNKTLVITTEVSRLAENLIRISNTGTNASNGISIASITRNRFEKSIGTLLFSCKEAKRQLPSNKE